MESTPPGGEDPIEPEVLATGYDNLDQIVFYFIVACILVMLGRYSDQVMAFGSHLYSKASKRGYQ